MNLKIVTYNVQFGVKANRIVGNIRKLAESGVSIFCLQEVKEFANQPSLLNAILDQLGEGWGSDTLIRTGSHDLGLVTLWKKDILLRKDSVQVLLPKLERFSRSELAARKLTLNFVETTLQRGALINTFHFGKKLIRICNLHLDCAGGFAQRAKQLSYTTRYLKSLPKVQFNVIAGDFNTIGITSLTTIQEKKLRSILGPSFMNVHPRAIPTYKYIPQRLDYIFVSSFEIQKAEVAKLKGSDHFPLIADLKIS